VGASVAWLAVETEDSPALFEAAQVEPNEGLDSHSQGSISGGRLKGGWFLLLGQGCDHRVVAPELLAALSQHFACVACSVEEHVMFSSAAYWKAGREIWSLTHDAQKGKYDLAVEGELPASFEELRRRVFQEQETEDTGQATVDYVFELPLLLAKELTGFKHDDDPRGRFEVAPVVFSDLAPKPPRPWWKVWYDDRGR
jgi:hypothetical protein